MAVESGRPPLLPEMRDPVRLAASVSGLCLAAASLRPAAQPPGGAAAGRELARKACVSCHAVPPPDTLPRAAWRGVLEKMSLIVEGRGIAGWGEPPPKVALSDQYRAILAYYEAAAPAALASPEAWPAPDAALRFVARPVGWKDALTQEPAVANLQLVRLGGDARPAVVAGDMRQGSVLLGRPAEPRLDLVQVATVPHPAHVSVADLDRDGRLDLLVADLGEFFPGEHAKGAAVWLRALAGGGYTAHSFGGFPRVADVEAGDFDGDGRLDLLVAAFGWNKTGETALLLNRTSDWSQPRFDRVSVDARPGAIQALPVELNGDGKLDFVALISQEHEAVVAFLGDGRGAFAARELYRAPHPSWGSTGIQLVDLDGDGRTDVLVTNGDMFDDDIVKPYHGIQWLENKGGLRFEARPLARLAGAIRALAADLDGDGDRDVVASAFTGAGSRDAALPSLVWLEQTKRRQFQRHTIAVGFPSYPTLDVGDVDGDGDADIVAGLFRLRGTADRWLDVWLNEGRPRAR